MPDAISSILLAGGKSSRMGKDKAKLKLDGGLMVLQSIAGKLLMISDEVIVATDGRRYEGLDAGVRWVDDVYPGAGSLVGLYSGLREARSDYALVVACDMPFLNLDLLRYMISLPRGYDALAPKIDDKIETLHAIYSKSCLPLIERMLEAGHKAIIDIFPRVQAVYLSREIIERYDPGCRSLFNINSPEQLAEARAIIDEEKGQG
jgi:molybdopterin-guanine dinucleotide biosynthesis protein A